MKPMSHVLSSLATFGAFVLSGSAMAFDRKVYSGNICQPEFPSYAANLEALPEGARNASTTARSM